MVCGFVTDRGESRKSWGVVGGLGDRGGPRGVVGGLFGSWESWGRWEVVGFGGRVVGLVGGRGWSWEVVGGHGFRERRVLLGGREDRGES